MLLQAVTVMQKGETEQQRYVLKKGRKNNVAVIQLPSPTERRTAASLGVSKAGERTCLRSKQESLCYYMLQDSEY